MKKKSSFETKSKFGLKARMVVYFLIVGLIPFFTVSVINYYQSSNTLNETITNEFESIIYEKELYVDEYFAEREGDLTAISTLERVKSMVPAQINEALKPFYETYGVYENIFVINASGVIIGDGKDGASIGVECAQYEWFPRLNATQKMTWALPQISPVTGLPVITISMPINGSAVVGYIVAAVFFNPVADNLQNTKGLGVTGESYLVDIKGMMLTDSRFTKGLAFNSSFLLDSDGVVDGISNIDTKDYINSARYLDYRGIEVFGVWHTIPEFQWVLIIEIDTAEAFAPLDQLLQITLMLSLVVSLLVIGIAYFIGSGLANPILGFHRFVSTITKNDLTTKLDYHNNYETGELAQGLRDLLTQLKTFVLENKNMANQLAVAAEELSSSAEEVSSASENIASSQQQISRGASNQVNAITDTQKKFNQLNVGIRQIREKVENITMVSEMIKNIANQTNMLALNAAIEAARAGDAGRGFNVVADQVRKLAEESRKAVENTDKMLEEIDAITKIQETEALHMLSAIDSIATVSEETSASTEESAAAAEEQASSMELISSTSQQLLSLAEQLKSLSAMMIISEEDEKNFRGYTLQLDMDADAKMVAVKENFEKMKQAADERGQEADEMSKKSGKNGVSSF
jgi:methyl-accepting chemotaxis protein